MLKPSRPKVILGSALALSFGWLGGSGLLKVTLRLILTRALEAIRGWLALVVCCKEMMGDGFLVFMVPLVLLITCFWNYLLFAMACYLKIRFS